MRLERPPDIDNGSAFLSLLNFIFQFNISDLDRHERDWKGLAQDIIDMKKEEIQVDDLAD